MDWATSDWHLQHRKMRLARSEDYETQLIEDYVSKVSCDDTVYILGDVMFRSHITKPWFAHLSETLAGRKILVRGNHDYPIKRFPDSYWLDECGFSEVHQDCLAVGPVFFSHLPIINDDPEDQRYPELTQNLYRAFILSGCSINVHGHTHGWRVRDDRCMGVSLEQTGYGLVNVTDLLLGEGDPATAAANVA